MNLTSEQEARASRPVSPVSPVRKDVNSSGRRGTTELVLRRKTNSMPPKLPADNGYMTFVRWQAILLRMGVLGLIPACSQLSDNGSFADTAPAPVDPSDTASLEPAQALLRPGKHGDHPSESAPDTSNKHYLLRVRVTLDGAPPGESIKLKQGGVHKTFKTDANGLALMGVQLTGVGQIVIHASHPDARVGAKLIEPEDLPDTIHIPLTKFDRSDNPEYKFIYPGTPEDELSCAHCHNNINRQWYGSAHQRAASNPFFQDVYSGVVSALSTKLDCEQAGGRWMLGIIPGTKDKGHRCYVGPGALPDLNAHCGLEQACDEVATNFGRCADCHAPGINGQIGGRNLLEATGTPYKFGVHCDVCHRVESVDRNGAPGVGGALKLLRPSEPPFASFLQNLPLTFGPFMDVSNYEMGAVQRDHFGRSEFCAGCHDYRTSVDPKWGSIDLERWPSGSLPVQSTYSEWLESPFNPTAPCGSCHMPPNAHAWNGADLEDMKGGFEQSARAGWLRKPGEVRLHTWEGPRTPGSDMLELAVDLSISKTQVKDGKFSFDVRVNNVGPGHALPTGLPSRSVILLVKAYCGNMELAPLGGHRIPDFAEYISKRDAEQDWTRWPKAKVGDKIRVLRHARDGGWINYQGPGRFGDGSLAAWQKGLISHEIVAERTVRALLQGGRVRLDKPLPRGDLAILSEPVSMTTGVPRKVAGAPGFAFGRVFADKDGNLNVPSFRAVDIVSDNRLRSQQGFQTQHTFEGRCKQAPVAHAVLLYRAFPPSWVRHWRWDRDDKVIAQERRVAQ